MIGWLNGRVVHQHLNGAIVLDVNGVGYELSVSSSASYRVGEEVELFVYTVVRADAIQLYGFDSYADREFFELLLITPGVGPSTALAALRTMSIAELAAAISVSVANAPTTYLSVCASQCGWICVTIPITGSFR